MTMEIKIGVQSVPRELVVETDTPAEQIERDLQAALTGSPFLTIVLIKGGKVMVPSDKIGYVEFGPGENRRVGFGNIG
jgi:Protein of unknown function (DUF3107)